jgi:hypothetical protein
LFIVDSVFELDDDRPDSAIFGFGIVVGTGIAGASAPAVLCVTILSAGALNVPPFSSPIAAFCDD